MQKTANTQKQNNFKGRLPHVSMHFGHYYMVGNYVGGGIPISYTIYNTAIKGWVLVASINNRKHAVQFIKLIMGG